MKLKGMEVGGAEQSLAETWTLYAGEDACDGAERLRCGDSVSFSLTSAYYQDPETGMRSLCVLSDHDDVEQLVLTMSAASDTWTGLSLVHPGHTPAEALTAGEPDGVANMANMAALLWDFLPELNWAGFYRVVEDELVLGPFMGRPACIRIPMGQGVCGTAAKDAATQLVERASRRLFYWSSTVQ